MVGGKAAIGEKAAQDEFPRREHLSSAEAQRTGGMPGDSAPITWPGSQASHGRREGGRGRKGRWERRRLLNAAAVSEGGAKCITGT